MPLPHSRLRAGAAREQPRPQQQQQRHDATAATAAAHTQEQQQAEASPGHQQQQQQHQQHPQHPRLWRQFQADHYGHMLHQDAFFFIAHLIMSAIHKRVLVTEREQLAFNAALALFSGGLLTLVFFRGTYRAARPHLVLTMHVLLTFIRAAVVNSMDSKQAVHFRFGLGARNATSSDDATTLAQLRTNTNTPGHLLLTMLAVLGGPFRLFEMLGLQQPFRWHAAVALLYVVVHPLAALNGIRLAYSNTMFYLVHELHDLVAALVDAVLSGLVGLPPLQQQTCSSCAGVAVYATVCLFGSVAAPLYVMYCAEQAAFKRWCARQASLAPPPAPASAPTSAAAQPPAAAAAAAAGAGERGRQPAQPPECEPRQQRGSRRVVQQQQQAQQQQLQLEEHLKLLEQQFADDSQHAGAPWPHAWGSPLAVQHWLLRWLVHALALTGLFLLCWLAANAFALLLLPRVLSSRQLAFYCPNRPYTPFIISGQVYDGA